MSVAPVDSVALRARACRIPSSVDAPAAVIDFVLDAVRLWQLPPRVTEQCSEAAGVLTTAMLRRTTAAVHVEVWLHLDAVRLRVRDVMRDAAGDTPPTGLPVADEGGLVSIDFGSGTATIRLGPDSTREGAGDEPDLTSGVSGARYARAQRRLPLSPRFSRGAASPIPTTKGLDDDASTRRRQPRHGGGDGVPAPRRG